MSIDISGGLRKYAVSFVLMLGSITLLAVYLLAYVPSNEKKIYERNFRELKNIAKNSDLKFESLLNSKERKDLILDSVSKFHFLNIAGDTLFYDEDSLFYYRREVINKRDQGVKKSESIESFFNGIIESELFSQVAIIDSKGNTLYGTQAPFPVIGKTDTLFNKRNLFISGVVYNQSIYGEEHSVFILPYLLDKKLPLLLCGFVPQTKIRAEKFSFRGSYVLVLLSVIIYFIISLPFLKLLLLNESELLSSYDLLFGLLGLVIGFALTIFMVFDTCEFGIRDPDRRDIAIKNLADLISSKFEDEIVSALHQLKESDIIANSRNHEKDSMNYIKNGRIIKNGKIVDDPVPGHYRNFVRTNWYDKKGELILIWQNDSAQIVSSLIGKSFAKREYFKAIKENKLFQINRPGYTLRFGFQPLYSWIDKKFYTDISRKSTISTHSKKALVSDITALMRSVTHTVLPYGYGFSIINQEGEVQYHSNMKKNLRENILEECDNSEVLKEALETNSSRYFSTNYERKPHRFYIKPISQLPLFICVFYNQQVSYGSNLHIFSYYIIFMSILIMLALFILGAILLKRYRENSLLHRNKIDIGWLWPKKSLTGMYTRLTFFNILLFVISCPIILCSTFNPVATFGILVYNILISCLCYYLHFIRDFEWKEEDKPGHISLLKLIKSEIFPTGSFLFLFAATFWVVLKFADTKGRELFLLYIILSTTIFVLTFKVYGQKRFKKIWTSFIFRLKKIYALFESHPVEKSSLHFHRYSLMFFSWVILCFGISSIRLFHDAFNLESVNLVKYRQYLAAKAILENKKADEFVFKSLSPDEKKSTLLYSGNYLNDLDSTRIVEDEVKGFRAPDSFTDQRNFDSLATFIRMHVGWIADDLQTPLIKDNITRPFRYRYTYSSDSNSIQLHYIDPVFRKSPLNSIHLYSSFPSYRFSINANLDTSWGNAFPVMLWLSVLAFMLMIFHLIYYFVKRVFDYSTYQDSASEVEWSLIIDKRILVLNSKDLCESNDELLKSCYMDNNEFDEINLAVLESNQWGLHLHIKLNSKNENLLIRNFDFDIFNKESNGRRVEVLRKMLESNKKNIVIVIAVNPLDFEKIIKNRGICYDPCDLTYFQTQVESLLGKSLFVPEIITKKNDHVTLPKMFEDAIEYEFKYSPLLKNYKVEISREAREILKKEDPEDPQKYDNFKEQVVIRTQVLAQLHYRWIWNNLSREERFFLFDFAKDGLMNYKNHSVIQSLTHKKLLIMDETFRRRIFNRSFRNFCLESLDEKQRQEFKEHVHNNGSWQKFKKPLLTAIMLIALFIFITQRDSFNTVVALLTTFTAGVPVILRLFTMFEGAGLKKV